MNHSRQTPANTEVPFSSRNNSARTAVCHPHSIPKGRGSLFDKDVHWSNYSLEWASVRKYSRSLFEIKDDELVRCSFEVLNSGPTCNTLGWQINRNLRSQMDADLTRNSRGFFFRFFFSFRGSPVRLGPAGTVKIVSDPLTRRTKGTVVQTP